MDTLGPIVRRTLLLPTKIWQREQCNHLFINSKDNASAEDQPTKPHRTSFPKPLSTSFSKYTDECLARPCSDRTLCPRLNGVQWLSCIHCYCACNGTHCKCCCCVLWESSTRGDLL